MLSCKYDRYMMTTANMILETLGGNKFLAMTGAKNLVCGENMLMFAIPKNQSRGNKMRITMDATDTYTVEVFKIRGCECAKLAEREMVYAESLRNVFTTLTGMETAL